MSEVAYITRVSKFLPNEPISNDEMESYLGMINGQPSKARSMILRSNGIKQRYYAIDKNGNPTHTNAEITSEAIKALADKDMGTEDFDLIACGTTSPDQLLPSHASMVHGILGDTHRELASFSSACCSGVSAMRYAYLAVRAGEKKYAVATGSERLSTWMKAEKFKSEVENLAALQQNPYIAFEKDFLRWMLSDGAGAMLIQGEPNKEGDSFRIDWIEMTSYGHEIESCMYAGGVKNSDGSITGWSDLSADEGFHQSVFSMKQDVKILRDNIVQKGYEFLQEVAAKHNFDIDTIDYFLPHLSSHFFKDPIFKALEENNLAIPEEKWFLNLSRVGNVGSASVYLMLEELLYSGKLKKGDKILIMIPESARFLYAYVHLTVV